jgi:hypothetical protein
VTPPPGPRIVDRVEEAAELMTQGTDVVLVLDPGVGHITLPSGPPGRLAVLVGRLDEPAVRAAAEEMAAELFVRR